MRGSGSGIAAQAGAVSTGGALETSRLAALYYIRHAAGLEKECSCDIQRQLQQAEEVRSSVYKNTAVLE